MIHKAPLKYETFIVSSKIQQLGNKKAFSLRTLEKEARVEDFYLKLKNIFLDQIRQNIKLKVKAKATGLQPKENKIPSAYSGLPIYFNMKYTQNGNTAEIQLSSIYIPKIQQQVDKFLDKYKPRSLYPEKEIMRIDEEHLQKLSTVYQQIKAIENHLQLYDLILQQLLLAFDYIKEKEDGQQMEGVKLSFKQITRKRLDQIRQDGLLNIRVQDFANRGSTILQDRNHNGRLHHKTFLMKRMKISSILWIFQQIPQELKQQINKLFAKCKQSFICSCCPQLKVNNHESRQNLNQKLDDLIKQKQATFEDPLEFTHECAQHFYQYQFMLQLRQYLRIKEEKEYIQKLVDQPYLKELIQYLQPRKQSIMLRDFVIKYRPVIMKQVIEKTGKIILEDEKFLSWMRIYSEMRYRFDEHYQNKLNEIYQINVNLLNDSQNLLSRMKWVSVFGNTIKYILQLSSNRESKQRLILDAYVDFQRVKEQMKWLRHLSELVRLPSSIPGLLKDEIDCFNPYQSEVRRLVQMCQKASLTKPKHSNSQSSPRLALVIIYVYLQLKELENDSAINQKYAAKVIDNLYDKYYVKDYRPSKEQESEKNDIVGDNAEVKQKINDSLSNMTISEKRYKTSEIFSIIEQLYNRQQITEATKEQTDIFSIIEQLYNRQQEPVRNEFAQ